VHRHQCLVGLSVHDGHSRWEACRAFRTNCTRRRGSTGHRAGSSSATSRLPLLKPVLLPAITLGTIWTFNNFERHFGLFRMAASRRIRRIFWCRTCTRRAFNLYRYGYGAALSMVIFFHVAGIFHPVFEADACHGKRVHVERTAIDARIKMDHGRTAHVVCCCLSRSRAFILRSMCCRSRCGREIGCARPTLRSFRMIGRCRATCSYSREQPFLKWLGNSLVVRGRV